VAIDHYVVYRGTEPVFVPASGNLAEDSNRTGEFDKDMANGVK